MSTLIVALPVPPRLSSQGAAGAALAPTEYEFVFSADDGPKLQTGRAEAPLLPRAQQVVAVVPPQAIGWHRVTLPKAPPAKLRAALVGMLEDVLLEDDGELHLAVAPHAKAGDSVWIAALSKAWIKTQIDAIEATGLTVDRVSPAWPPDDAPAGHFFPGEPLPDGSDSGPQFAWRDVQGPFSLPANSDATRTMLARMGSDIPVRWTSQPECATDAVRLAGDNVAAVSGSEFLYNASRGEWNLRQFDLIPQRRGSRAAKELLQQLWLSPTWRPARFGIAALLLLNIVGANVWAWQQRQAVSKQKAAMTSLLQTTFPQVRLVSDVPAAQMQKELDLLRAAAGKPGEGDLESLMYAAEAAWPTSRTPADGLKYEPGRLIVSSAGWSPQEVEGFRGRLRPLGYDAESVPGRLTLTPLKPGDIQQQLVGPGATRVGAGSPPGAGPNAAVNPNAQPNAASPSPMPPPANRAMPGAVPPGGQRQAGPQPGGMPHGYPQRAGAGPVQPQRMPTQSPTGVNEPVER